jgi:hypothetical protein
MSEQLETPKIVSILRREILEGKINNIKELMLAYREGDTTALVIAREDINRRLEAMNELRTQITEERGMYVLRDRHDSEYDLLRDHMDSRIKVLESSKANVEGRMWAIGALMSALVVIINCTLYYFSHH